MGDASELLTDEQRHAFVVETEKRIRELEQVRPPSPHEPEWTMWMDLRPDLAASTAPSPLVLRRVDSPQRWQELLTVRTTAEAAFGLRDPILMRRLMEDAQRKTTALEGRWYLAQRNDELVGEIGIIPFGDVGRLQDVDIIPEQQGQGLGRALLQALINTACEQRLAALCLMAKAEGWPRLWYQRAGFRKVGEVAGDTPIT